MVTMDTWGAYVDTFRFKRGDFHYQLYFGFRCLFCLPLWIPVVILTCIDYTLNCLCNCSSDKFIPSDTLISLLKDFDEFTAESDKKNRKYPRTSCGLTDIVGVIPWIALAGAGSITGFFINLAIKVIQFVIILLIATPICLFLDAITCCGVCCEKRGREKERQPTTTRATKNPPVRRTLSGRMIHAGAEPTIELPSDTSYESRDSSTSEDAKKETAHQRTKKEKDDGKPKARRRHRHHSTHGAADNPHSHHQRHRMKNAGDKSQQRRSRSRPTKGLSPSTK